MDLNWLWFKKAGYPAFLLMENLTSAFLNNDNIQHELIKNKEIDKVISNAMQEQLIKEEMDPLQSLIKMPCNRTRNNYSALIAILEGVSEKTSCTDKTIKHEIVENSYCVIMCYVCVAAITYIIPTNCENKAALTTYEPEKQKEQTSCFFVKK